MFNLLLLILSLYYLKDLCKGGWTEYRSYCYKVFDDLATFYQAKSSCIREGARLASIEDFGELRFLKTFLEGVFLGMTDITEEERSVWTKWSIYTPGSLWHGYDPNDGVRENYLVYVQEQGFQFKKYYESTRYVCKYSLCDVWSFPFLFFG